MMIIVTKNYKEMSKRAAGILIDEVLKKPSIIIGFVTGETPFGLYKELVKAYKKKKVDFSKVRSFNLDEYYPIKRSDKDSYYYYMFKHLFNKINIKKSNINLLDGETKNPRKECENYERKIRKSGIDIQLLGIGVNGHIAFNEPGSSFNSKTRIVELNQETIKSNSKFFSSKKIPRFALTMGISTIMSAKEIILLASGKEKAKDIKCLVEGPITSNFPASFLKKHRDFVVIVDKDAASMLTD